MTLRMGPHFPVLRARRVMVKQAQRFGQRRRVRAFETGAADHHVDAMPTHIGADGAPEELERALVAMARENA